MKPVRVTLLALNLLLVSFLVVLSVATGIYGPGYAMLGLVPLVATAALTGLGARLHRSRPGLGLALLSIPLVVTAPLLVRIYGETVMMNLPTP